METAGALLRPKSSTKTGVLLDKTSKGLNRKGVKTKSDKNLHPRIESKNRLKSENNKKEKIDGKFRLKSNVSSSQAHIRAKGDKEYPDINFAGLVYSHGSVGGDNIHIKDLSVNFTMYPVPFTQLV
ncbi:hypothetical protein BTVI_38475 [Pitangus sulphuratus]|nr:hypothetical protein BTVI_38475 [Pitangus sulphuratus]